MRRLVLGLLHLFSPAGCPLCRVPLPATDGPFCPDCRAALVNDRFPTCPRCAGTVGPYAHVEGGCLRCRNVSFAFERAVRLGYYEGRLRDAILCMKSSAGEGLAELVGALWAEQAEERLRTLAADVVVPVPLHWRRRLRRGYNQSETIARAVAARLGRPCHPGWLRRVRHTPRQTAQTPAARHDNLRGAFQGSGRVSGGATVLLIDDVLTTGSTASEAARALRQAGAARVLVAVLARSHA